MKKCLTLIAVFALTCGMALAAGPAQAEVKSKMDVEHVIPAPVENGAIYLSGNSEQAEALELLDPPVITNPILTLFFPEQNMYQFTHIWQDATYTYWVAAGSATLQPIQGDCYITTQDGASVCVSGTNSAGTGTPYCFYVPAANP